MTGNENNFPDNWTYGHALCYVYFAFAELTDGDFSDDEASVIQTKCLEWNIPGDTFEEAYKFFAGKSYQATSENVASQWLVICDSSSGYSLENKRAMLADLKSIANADGKITEAESRWLIAMEETVASYSG